MSEFFKKLEIFRNFIISRDTFSTFADNLPLNLPLPPGMDLKEDTTIPFPDIPHSPVVLEHINRPLTLQERKQLFVKAEDWNIEWEPFKSRADRFDHSKCYEFYFV